MGDPNSNTNTNTGRSRQRRPVGDGRVHSTLPSPITVRVRVRVRVSPHLSLPLLWQVRPVGDGHLDSVAGAASGEEVEASESVGAYLEWIPGADLIKSGAVGLLVDRHGAHLFITLTPVSLLANLVNTAGSLYLPSRT